jgi:hypothetical protein
VKTESALETGPLIKVEITKGNISRHAWSMAGQVGAEQLFAEYPFTRKDPNPGSLVYLHFDHLDLTEELRLAAIAGFNRRWAELVPGWKPEIPDNERPLGA